MFTNKNLLEAKDVNVAFGGLRALSKVDLAVGHHEVVGLIGPNGAGKSTALRCLLGLAAPSSGSARVLGAHYQELDAPQTKVGAVLDSRGFHAGLTGRQNLRVVAAAAGISNARVDEVLQMVELTDAASKRVKGYSMGMKQRLSLAGALLGDPKVLILDEPTSGLDVITAENIIKLIRDCKDQGKTVIFSSHIMSEVDLLCDELAIVHKGQLKYNGPMSDFRQNMEASNLTEEFIRIVQR